MVRSTARSRGCRTCRNRRIKCDEFFPECTQCKKYGQKCPGPITGTFYIIASEGRTRPLGGSSNFSEPRQSSRLSGSGHISPNLDSSNGAPNPVAQCAVAMVDPSISSSFDVPAVPESSKDVFASTLPSWYQPSRASIFDQLFFSHFLEECGRGVETVGACSWISKLPGRMATSFSSPALAYSTRATFMSFYGLLVGEISLQTEARRIYAEALKCRRADLCRDATQEQQNAGHVLASEESICITVMMCYFELITKTTPKAWVQHLNAAASMIETLGPGGCQFGFLHQLFRTVRLSVAFACVVFKTTHCFTEERWRTVPFRGRPKTQLDQVVDVLLSIPEHFCLADRMVCMVSAVELQESQQRFRTGLSHLISNLDNQLQTSAGLCAQTISSLTAPSDTGLESHMAFYSDISIGCLAAIRHAAYLVCFSLLVSKGAETDYIREQALRHSEAVLAAVEYVDNCSQPAAGSLYMSTVFSLNAMLEWSPSPMHKTYALQKIELYSK